MVLSTVEKIALPGQTRLIDQPLAFVVQFDYTTSAVYPSGGGLEVVNPTFTIGSFTQFDALNSTAIALQLSAETVQTSDQIVLQTPQLVSAPQGSSSLSLSVSTLPSSVYCAGANNGPPCMLLQKWVIQIANSGNCNWPGNYTFSSMPQCTSASSACPASVTSQPVNITFELKTSSNCRSFNLGDVSPLATVMACADSTCQSSSTVFMVGQAINVMTTISTLPDNKTPISSSTITKLIFQYNQASTNLIVNQVPTAKAAQFGVVRTSLSPTQILLQFNLLPSVFNLQMLQSATFYIIMEFAVTYLTTDSIHKKGRLLLNYITTANATSPELIVINSSMISTPNNNGSTGGLIPSSASLLLSSSQHIIFLLIVLCLFFVS